MPPFVCLNIVSSCSLNHKILPELKSREVLIDSQIWFNFIYGPRKFYILTR